MPPKPHRSPTKKWLIASEQRPPAPPIFRKPHISTAQTNGNIFCPSGRGLQPLLRSRRLNTAATFSFPSSFLSSRNRILILCWHLTHQNPIARRSPLTKPRAGNGKLHRLVEIHRNSAKKGELRDLPPIEGRNGFKPPTLPTHSRGGQI